MLWDAEQSDRHRPAVSGRAGSRQSLCPGEPSMGTLCAGKGCRLDSRACRSGRPDLDLDATFRAGAGYRRVGGLGDSSHTREVAHCPQPMDATADFPGVASGWSCPATGEAFATDKDDLCGCWLHTPRAGCHRLLCKASAGPASGKPDTGVSHQAGAQSLDQKRDRLCRASPLGEQHSLLGEPCAARRTGKPEQCALQWELIRAEIATDRRQSLAQFLSIPSVPTIPETAEPTGIHPLGYNVSR